jgi:hypothetical protein
MHEAQQRGERVRELLETRFGISHVTLELECHPCQPDSLLEHHPHPE